MSKLLAVAQFETTLASGISKTATVAELVSNITGDQDDAVLPNGDYGFVIDERNGYREYVIATISGTGATFVKRGLSFIDGDTVKTGNKFAHRKGASIKIVSFPIITRMLAQMNGDLAYDGVPKLPASRTINNARQLIDKEYADAILTSGIPALAVSDNGGITININSGYYSLNGDITFYAGASNQSLTDDTTNYVELLNGALSINTTAFSDDAMPLAVVVTSGGDITSLTDARAILGWLDIKASSGIGRDSNGIFVDLDTDPGLEFNSGKLRIKIKASGGIVRDSDGLSVDTGTTANKIVKLDGDAKLPAVDASQLLNLPGDKLSLVTTNVVLASSAVETSLLSVAIPANTLSTNNGIRVRMNVSNWSNTSGGTLTFRLKYGATTLVTSSAFNIAVAQNGVLEFLLLAAGATNSQEGLISLRMIATSSTAANNNYSLGNTEVGTSAIDSTADANLVITGQWSASSSSNTITINNIIVEKIR